MPMTRTLLIFIKALDIGNSGDKRILTGIEEYIDVKNGSGKILI